MNRFKKLVLTRFVCNHFGRAEVLLGRAEVLLSGVPLQAVLEVQEPALDARVAVVLGLPPAVLLAVQLAAPQGARLVPLLEVQGALAQVALLEVQAALAQPALLEVQGALGEGGAVAAAEPEVGALLAAQA